MTSPKLLFLMISNLKTRATVQKVYKIKCLRRVDRARVNQRLMSAAVVGYELDDSGVVGREKPGDEHAHTHTHTHARARIESAIV
jgi:hypothetical protein